MSVPTCEDAFQLLLAKDLSSWAGLPATCTLANVSKLELGDDETSSVLGEAGEPATYRRARAPGYLETLTLWLRGGQLAKVSAPLPALSDVPGLLATLGPPDAKLDAWSAATPVLRREAEWVYARRGLALVMSSDRRSVLELMVFPVTTLEAYRKVLRFTESPREHPE